MDITTIADQAEKVSRIYTKKFGIKRNNAWYMLKLQEELGELTQSFLMYSGQARKKGKTGKELKQEFGEEVADVFCQLLLLARHNKLDLEKIIRDKWFIWLKE